jgi:hypothetical protein
MSCATQLDKYKTEIFDSLEKLFCLLRYYNDMISSFACSCEVVLYS